MLVYVTTNTPYDLDSIMHYPNYNLGCSTTSDPSVFTPGVFIPTTKRLSTLDVERLIADYGYTPDPMNVDWSSLGCVTEGILTWDSISGAVSYRIEASGGDLRATTSSTFFSNWATLSIFSQIQSYRLSQ